VLGSLFGRTFAFVGLERVGGIAVYDVTNPASPEFVTYANNRDFTADPETPEAGDFGPEGLVFVPFSHGPTHMPLQIVANEISGTTTVFEIGMSR
jgi:hypothetical protein